MLFSIKYYYTLCKVYTYFVEYSDNIHCFKIDIYFKIRTSFEAMDEYHILLCTSNIILYSMFKIDKICNIMNIIHTCNVRYYMILKYFYYESYELL